MGVFGVFLVFQNKKLNGGVPFFAIERISALISLLFLPFLCRLRCSFLRFLLPFQGYSSSFSRFVVFIEGLKILFSHAS